MYFDVDSECVHLMAMQNANQCAQIIINYVILVLATYFEIAKKYPLRLINLSHYQTPFQDYFHLNFHFKIVMLLIQ
jgi:hypothetical protein